MTDAVIQQFEQMAVKIAALVQRYVAKAMESRDAQIEQLLSTCAKLREDIASVQLREGPQGPVGEKGAPGPEGERGPQGEAGPQGSQGIQGERGADGANGKDGAPGVDGRSVELDVVRDAFMPALLEQMRSTVAHELATWPRPKDGVDGKDGAPGPQGERGEAGPTGPQGERGIAGERGERGADGGTGPAGERGTDGAPGINGKDGAEGRDGRDGPPGRDAAQIAPQFGIESGRAYARGSVVFHRGGTWWAARATDALQDAKKGDPDALRAAGWECAQDGIHELSTTISDSGREKMTVVTLTSGRRFESTEPVASIKHRGVFKEGEAYCVGDVVTWDGSSWFCASDATRQRPGVPGDSDWRLIAKRGRDGKDGTPGERGAEGRPGRDARQH